MTDRPIHYEPHPVTPERKAELMALGVKIIDARFKPADTSAPEPNIVVEAAPVQRKTRKQRK